MAKVRQPLNQGFSALRWERNKSLFSLTSNGNIAFPSTMNVGHNRQSMNSTCDFVTNRNHRDSDIILQLLQVILK